MSTELTVNGTNYRITTDPCNIILEKSVFNTDETSKNFQTWQWKDKRYLNSPQSVAQAIMDSELRSAIDEGVSELTNYVNNRIRKSDPKKDPADAVVLSVVEHTKLIENSNLLDALVCGGVDNWVGYGEAIEAWEEAVKEDETPTEEEQIDYNTLEGLSKHILKYWGTDINHKVKFKLDGVDYGLAAFKDSYTPESLLQYVQDGTIQVVL